MASLMPHVHPRCAYRLCHVRILDALIGPGFLYIEQKEWLTQVPCFLI